VPVVFASSEPNRLIGSLSLVIRTDSQTSGPLSLQFLGRVSGRGAVHVIPAARASASRRVLVEGSRLPKLRPGGAVPLVLLFRLPQDTSLAEAEGTLIARVNPPGAKPVSATLRTGAQLGEVKLLPAKVTLQHTSWCLFGCGDDSAVIDIRGPGAQALPQTGVVSTAVLSGDRSGTATVELKRDGTQWVVDRIDSRLGAKTGDLPLVTGGNEPPAIQVEVKEGLWFGIAVFFVLIGSLLGGLVLPLYGIGRRRRILLDAMDAALARYKKAVQEADAGEDGQSPRFAPGRLPPHRRAWPRGHLAAQALSALHGAAGRLGNPLSYHYLAF
jgi:hypothetical protein